MNQQATLRDSRDSRRGFPKIGTNGSSYAGLSLLRCWRIWLMNSRINRGGATVEAEFIAGPQFGPTSSAEHLASPHWGLTNLPGEKFPIRRSTGLRWTAAPSTAPGLYRVCYHPAAAR